MHVGKYSRALATAAVMGLAVAGPVGLVGPADATPGNGHGHAKGKAHQGMSQAQNLGEKQGRSRHKRQHTSRGHGHGHSHGQGHGNGQVGGRGNGGGHAGGQGNGGGHAGGNAGAGGQKVYVCKYVSTPGENERLQTGNNPIEVSVNAIPSHDGGPAEALLGEEFADGQIRSVVIAVSAGPGGGQRDEPTIADCPPAQQPPGGEEPPPPGGEKTPPGGEEGTPPGGEEGTPPGGEEETPPEDTEVEGKQDRDPDRDTDIDSDSAVEVRGKQASSEQAAAPSVVAQVPTAVNAGISAGVGLVTSPIPLLVSLLGLMLAAAGWLVRRRRA